MRVLIFHGYMLRGTGSNIYNANLARALAALGHEVHLLCQEREVEIEGVEIHNPEIDGLLPVYVKDPYEGFEVKAFPELSEAELRRYLDANVAAVRAVAAAAGGIDAALANHLVMGPAVLARAAVSPYAVKIHGSALEYTVKPNPERFLPYAREGLAGAGGVLVGSLHTAESLWAALPDLPRLREKTRLGPPGVDVEEFRPAGLPRAVGRVRRQADRLQGGGPAARRLAAGPRRPPRRSPPGRRLRRVRGRAAPAVGGARARRPRRGPRGRAAGLGAGGGEEKPLPILSRFLAEPPAGYAATARAAAGSVEFIGRLEHREVAELFPRVEAAVMPSTFPEAFGMVAVEAAACGALPVSAGHSGMLEVSRQLAPELPPAVAPLLSFPVGAGSVEAIAARLDGWLALPPGARAGAREALVATVARLWSWEGVARGVLAAAAGEIGELPLP